MIKIREKEDGQLLKNENASFQQGAQADDAA
jgi:hypothetical protein